MRVAYKEEEKDNVNRIAVIYLRFAAKYLSSLPIIVLLLC